ncbi:MAG: PhoU family transcriptional regulator, partial [Campylobacterota bacterium]|nr:PhoU family transcriptional regulator [Campylobacterota bacterium]
IKILALHTPGTTNLRHLVSYLKITNDLVRATYSTKSFIKKFTTVCDNLDIAVINEYATPMQSATIKSLEISISMISIEDSDEINELYDSVVIEENKSDDIYALVERNLISQARGSEETLKYHQMLRALRKSAKIASRSVSIANLLVYAKVGGDFHN